MRMSDIIRANKKAGHHWFDKEEMTYWNTKIESGVSRSGKFITSERDTKGGKRYTIRQFNAKTKKIETVGEFQQYETLTDAEKRLSDE